MKTNLVLSADKEMELFERIGGTYKDAYEHADSIFSFLKELPNDEQVKAFEYVLIKTNHPDTKKSGKRYKIVGLPEEAIDRLKNGLSKLIDGNFQYFLSKRPSSEELATQMWNVISNLTSEEEKVFSIAWLIIDKVLPYRQIPQGGVRMTDDTFKAIVDQLRPKVRMIESIWNYPGLTLTEEVSLTLGVILDGTTIEQQAVLMAALVMKIRIDEKN